MNVVSAYVAKALLTQITVHSVPDPNSNTSNFNEQLMIALQYYDPKLTVRMRKFNSCNVGSRFDVFLTYCRKFINQWKVTNDFRCDNVEYIGYLPVSLSTQNHIDITVDSVPK